MTERIGKGESEMKQLEKLFGELEGWVKEVEDWEKTNERAAQELVAESINGDFEKDVASGLSALMSWAN